MSEATPAAKRQRKSYYLDADGILSEFDRKRPIRQLLPEDQTVVASMKEINQELLCPVCLSVMKECCTTTKCIHRQELLCFAFVSCLRHGFLFSSNETLAYVRCCVDVFCCVYSCVCLAGMRPGSVRQYSDYSVIPCSTHPSTLTPVCVPLSLLSFIAWLYSFIVRSLLSSLFWFLLQFLCFVHVDHHQDSLCLNNILPYTGLFISFVRSFSVPVLLLLNTCSCHASPFLSPIQILLWLYV